MPDLVCSNKTRNCTGVACTICWGEREGCKSHMRYADYHIHPKKEEKKVD